MRGWVEHTLTGNCGAALDFFTSALEVMRWGQASWNDVPDEDKGAMFQPTMIRSLKRLRLNAFVAVRLRSTALYVQMSLMQLLPLDRPARRTWEKSRSIL